MAIDISDWISLGGGEPTAQEATRAALAWRRIQDKPTEVTFRRPPGSGRDDLVDPQTVRIEWDNSVSQSVSMAGRAPVRQLVIFGIKGHASESDTDIEVGYRCVIDSQEFRVIDVIFTIGELQARAEAVG